MKSQESKLDLLHCRIVKQIDHYGELVLFSTPSDLFRNLSPKVFEDLFHYFQEDKLFCHFQKAYNYALGRTAGYELLKELLSSKEFATVAIKNSQEKEDYGKPHLYIGQQKAKMKLSISHSQNASVVYCSSREEVGVDLELIRPRPKLFPVVVLSAEEYDWYQRSPIEKEFLLTCYWTAKEAVSKVLGTGLRIPTKDLEIQFPSSIKSLQDVLQSEVDATYAVRQDSHDSMVVMGSSNNDTRRKFSLNFSCINHLEHRFILCRAKSLEPILN